MEKNIKRISLVIFLLIMLWNNFCYADLAVSPLVEIVPVIWLNVVIIGLAVFIVSVISLFILHKSAKNNDEKNSEKSKKIGNRIYISTIILTIMVYLCLFSLYWKYESVFALTFPILIVIIVISIGLRKEQRKLSNILCVISVILVCVIALYIVVSDKIVENYNEQFLQYRGSFVEAINSRGYYVSDVEGLINTAIENNENGRKVTLIYKDTNYTSVDELKMLLSELNTNKNKNYTMNTILYDEHYIKSIELNEFYSHEWTVLLNYEGEQDGKSVRDLIIWAYSKVKEGKEIKINITYISETNQTTTVDIGTDNYGEIQDLMIEILNGKMYKVEAQSNSLNVYDITITD